MQTTLRIDDTTFREAKANAARRGMTLTRYIELALQEFSNSSGPSTDAIDAELEERNQIMEGLLNKTAHFRIGEKPTREEANVRASFS